MTQIPIPDRIELFGGDVGVLLLNQFPQSHSWAHALHAAGQTVISPSNTSLADDWRKIGKLQWEETFDICVDELHLLKSRCSKVFIFGYAIGASLALRLAESFGQEIEGLILVEPMLPPNLRLSKRWADIEKDLYLIEQPMLLLYAEQVGIQYQDDSTYIADEVSSAFIREIILESSFHTQQDEHDAPLLLEESMAFINEISSGVWLSEIENEDDSDLIDAEFQSIVAGLSLDQSSPSTYLDELDRLVPDDHFERPNPALAPISDGAKRNAIIAMVAGPMYAIVSAATHFNPFGIEPWPGVLTFFGGLAAFLYRLRDFPTDDDGAIL